MSEKPSLQMYWPEPYDRDAPPIEVPKGYILRAFNLSEVEADPFFALMDLVGWTGWDHKELAPWGDRLLPDGWFMVFHQATGKLVASAMALRSVAVEGGGELGWVAGHPEHAGIGLGRLITSAVIGRFLKEGCNPIHLFTEDFRLAALNIYLKLGFVPVLASDDATERWQNICASLNWSCNPDSWKNWEEILGN